MSNAFTAIYKKVNGTVRLTAKELIWSSSDASQRDLALPFETIKSKLIAFSPSILTLLNSFCFVAQAVNVVNSKSSKVLLKVTQWGNGDQGEANYNFQFNGQDAVGDREKLKESLAVHITAQRSNQPARNTPAATNSLTYHDIPLRQALLAKDKELSKLHRELVISGTLSEADFWSSRQVRGLVPLMLIHEALTFQIKQRLLANQNWESSQKKGTSSASLADIKPASEGSDLKYTLTPDIIHSIFIQYPSGRVNPINLA
jgi:hypothetical protein